MELKERIHRIKELLKYCTNDEVHVVDDKVGLFFANYINTHTKDGKSDLTHCGYSHAYPTIKLFTAYLNKDKIYPLSFDYCYDCDRDGEYHESYRFDDPEVTYEYDWEYPHHKIFYEDIPDEIWEIIEAWAFNYAKKTVKKELEEAEFSYKYWQEKEKEFKQKYGTDIQY